MDAEIDRVEPVPDEKALFRGWRLPRGDEFVPICILCLRVLRNEEDHNHVKATKRYLDVLKERGSIDENFCISALNDISVPLMGMREMCGEVPKGSRKISGIGLIPQRRPYYRFLYVGVFFLFL